MASFPPVRAVERAIELLQCLNRQPVSTLLTSLDVRIDAGLAQEAGELRALAATGVDRSTLADMIARMLDKGLLARERSAADARAQAKREPVTATVASLASRQAAATSSAYSAKITGSL